MTSATLGAALGCSIALAQTRELTVTIADLETAAFSVRGLRASLSGPKLGRLVLEIAEVGIAGRTWHKARLTCRELRTTAGVFACPDGVLDVGEPMPARFSYDRRSGELLAELRPARDESWHLTGRFAPEQRRLRLRADNARLDRFSAWLPAALPKLAAGRATGTITLSGSEVDAEIEIEGLNFADAAGLRAGEKVGATLLANARAREKGWAWSAHLLWRSGEVFWQPVFLAAAGQRLDLRAVTAGGLTRVEQGRLELPAVGVLEFEGNWDHDTGTLQALAVRGPKLAAGPLYETLLRPLLQETALADLRAGGEVTLALQVRGGELQSVAVDFAAVSLEDIRGRYALLGVNGRVPWNRGQVTTGIMSLDRAAVLGVPVGATRVPLTVRDRRIDVPLVRVPLLDGALILRDFAAGLASDGWRSRFSGELEPLSMAELTRTLGWPLMHGTFAGVVPEVRFRRRSIEMDGTLELRVFDGTVQASGVQLIEAFGRVPRLHADLTATRLDLELLTRTFDFGTITGRLDASVKGLELVAWRPVRFDARLASSPGSYPRRISQRAVENISALGGSGATAALQRTFLRFFDQFGYSRIGLSCRLENQVCTMEGIRPAGEGFVIIEGGGIPAVSVVGYNRRVDWPELVDRLRRVTQDQPIVK